MEQWRKDARKERIIIDIDSLVPDEHDEVIHRHNVQFVAMDAGYKTP